MISMPYYQFYKAMPDIVKKIARQIISVVLDIYNKLLMSRVY